MFTSCGILDEKLELYSMRVDPDALAKAVAQGNRAEGELITNVEAVPITDPRALEDGKLQMLLARMSAACQMLSPTRWKPNME